MKLSTASYSTVTAVLPRPMAMRVVDAALREPSASALVAKARGTLLHDHWLSRWLPPISPARTMLQMIVPYSDVDNVVGTIIDIGNLHRQATGAVFSTPCEPVYYGEEFHQWQGTSEQRAQSGAHGLNETLNVIYCIVTPRTSDKVAKAAINAGAHGPIVYLSEGRGLRDRLGWLRITKEAEKEVLMVIADDNDVEEIFDAMAIAGELHLPGRGFMYRLGIDKGLFNLPSRVSHHHYDANMQQIINAIDHLAGHTHWRDQSVIDLGGQGRAAGLESLNIQHTALHNQVCLSAIARRSDHNAVMEMLLDAGAPGLNVSYMRFAKPSTAEESEGARINEDYGALRCITDETQAERICEILSTKASARGINDICLLVHPVPRVVTYVPGNAENRKPARPFLLAS